MKIIFMNVSYMREYKGRLGDEMRGTFGYVLDTKDGAEKYNFKELDGYCYGYAEPSHGKGGYKKGNHKRIRVERLLGQSKRLDHLDGVLVVWCATLPDKSGSAIVGWYKNATLYDNTQEKEFTELEDGKRYYNVKAKVEDCVLLTEVERLQTKWEVYRSRTSKEKIGFGQSSLWYADKENAKRYVERIIKQIEEY